jgi:hypothetical protein
MNGSLVHVPLRRTRCHETDRLLLHFYVASAMMPRAPPVVVHSPVLSQNRETLLGLLRKPLDVDVCPHIVFIYPSVLRHKLINLLPLGFETQTKKSSW